MDDPNTTTVHLKGGESFSVGDSRVRCNPLGGYQVTAPGGFNGEPKTEYVPQETFAIGSDVVKPDGTIVRETVVFEAE